MPTGWFAGDLDTVERTPVTGWWAEISRTVMPGGAALSVTGGTPTLRIMQVYTPSGAALTVTGAAPTVTVTQHRLVQPAAAELSLIGSHPALGVTLRPAGAAPTVAGGQPVVRLSDNKTVQPGPATLEVVAGQPVADLSDHKVITPTGAPLIATGATPQIVTPQTFTPDGEDLELVGGIPTVSVGETLYPGAAALTITAGTPTVATPAVVRPSPAALTVTGSHPALGVTLRPAAATLAVTGGQPVVAVSDNKVYVPTPPTLTVTGGTPTVVATDTKRATPTGASLTITGGQPAILASNNKLATPTGASLTVAGGTPTIAIESTAVPLSIVGSAIVVADSITLPDHQAGDIFVLAGFSGLVPSKPSAGGTVPTWVDIDSSVTSGSAMGLRTNYAVATASNHTSGTWTNAAALAVVVLRGQAASSPIGGHAIATNGSAVQLAAAPAVTMSNTDGTSVLLHFHIAKALSTVAWSAAPAGYTRLQDTVFASNTNGLCVNYKNSTTADGSVNQAYTRGGSQNRNGGATVEIKD